MALLKRGWRAGFGRGSGQSWAILILNLVQDNRFLTKMFHNPLGYLVALALRTLPATMRGEHVPRRQVE